MTDREKQDPKQEWQAPRLTVLGDAETITQAAALAVPDGGAGSS